VVTAPPPDKLMPQSNSGISLGVLLLQRQFEFFLPLHRIRAELRSHELPLSAGTSTGGLHKLVPLLEPRDELRVEHQRAEDHGPGAESRWLVFVKQAGKAGFAWMLWGCVAQEASVFVLEPPRAHDVPEGHFGDAAAGMRNVDRYRACKAMAQVKAGQLILAFCGAHVRRAFLAVLTGWSALTDWAWSWVEASGLLYQRNDQRLAVREDAAPFAAAEQRGRAQVEHLRQRRDAELAQPNLRQPQRQALTRLQNHGAGLTGFLDHPEVPMDHHRTERCHRSPVVARQNFYGSGALWSGRLAARLFSLFPTTQAWGLAVGKWLTAYLSACAQAQGQPPPAPQRFLPWHRTAAARERLRVAKPKPPDSTPPDPDTSTETTA
jgi:transposase